MGTNKISSFENVRIQTLILRHGKENTDKVVFHQIKSSMQVQRVSVAKADGKVVFIPNVVPGDVIDVQTLKVLL
jgi:imidazole glycerol phosphate synthase subunit HisF